MKFIEKDNKILSTEKCSFGQTGFRFEVIGRSDDVITIKGANVFISAIESLIAEYLQFFTGVFQIHINKKEPIDRIVLKIEVKKRSLILDNNLKDEISGKFRERLVIKPEIDFVLDGELPRTEGKSKKIFRDL